MRRILLFAAALAAGLSGLRLWAADTMTGIFNERVRSLQVRPEGAAMGFPLICLDTGDRLLFSFDHLADDREYLRYELVHCNADWQPSGLVDSEFLDGFNLGNIDDCQFSSATTVRYVHYELAIPNAQVAPKVSGNYLLRVYPEGDPDDVWLQCRFYVSEQRAPIAIEATTRTDVDYNREHQQLAITVDTERADVPDPFNELLVVVQQNGRWDNEAVLRQPMRMARRGVSVYEHQPQLVFEAGNEYRRFECVSTTYPGMGVETVAYAEPYYRAWLETDHPRAAQPYYYDQTQHGRYLVREYNSDRSDVDADYVVATFALEMPEIEGADVYIDGDLACRRFDQASRMAYNRAEGRYELSMLLKQGAYNYQYLVAPAGAARGYTALIEGDKHQTVNEYLVKVYTRHPGDRADRLIGVESIYSNN